MAYGNHAFRNLSPEGPEQGPPPHPPAGLRERVRGEEVVPGKILSAMGLDRPVELM